MKNYFKDKEFIINDMRPVRPLINYLWSEGVVCKINQIGQGNTLACIQGERRNLINGKRYAYLKRSDGEIYSVNGNFSNLDFDEYSAVVGLGYQTITSAYKSIKATMCVTVPQNNYVELVKFTLENTGDKEEEFTFCYYTDVNANLTVHWSYGTGDVDWDFGGILYPHYHYLNHDEYQMIFAKSSILPSSMSVSDRDFFGVYGNHLEPDGLKKEKLSNEGTVFEENYCSAMSFDLKLKPNESREIVFAFGFCKDKKDAENISSELLQSGGFERELSAQKIQNTERLNVFTCQTPDEYFDILTNVWAKRQLSLGKDWGRVYGKGFRDVMQDIASFVSLDAPLAKKQIITAVSHQYLSGNAIRMYEPDFTYPYFDMPAWIPATVTQYVKESGDISILDEKLGYLDSDIEESLFDHVKRGLDFLISHRGKHDLVLWGGGDWNDSMNNAGMKMIGESVWLSIATVKAINEFLELLEFLGGHGQLLELYANEKARLVNAIQAHGWDKDHYIYGYADNGEVVGAYSSNEGKIYLNPQTWSILAGIKTGDEAKALMEVVENNLKCDFGYMQNVPPYTKGNAELGRSTYFKPGLCENASVYNHGCAFKIVSDCAIGKADAAYNTFLMMRYDNPLNKNSGVEPYAFTNMYIGPVSEYNVGFAPMSWVTGTAGWMYRAFSENILGVSAQYNGLKVAPCIPTSWNEAKVSRIYRGATYNITVVRKGFKRIIFDGKELDGNVLPVCAPNTEHTVEVSV